MVLVGLVFDCLVLLGMGKVGDMMLGDWCNFGGNIFVMFLKVVVKVVMVVLEDMEGIGLGVVEVVEFVMGVKLCLYSFDIYKMKKDDDGKKFVDLKFML